MEELIELLKNQAKTSKSLLKKLEAHKKLKTEPVVNVHSFEKSLREIKKLSACLPESQIRTTLTGWIDSEAGQIIKLKDDFHFNFGKDLKELLARQGKELRGQLPILRSGFWTIKVDFEIGSASIYWGPEVEKIKTKAVLNPQEIAKSIEELDKDLKKRSIGGRELFELIFRAYLLHLTVNRRASGEKILLVDLLGELVFLIQPLEFKNDPRRDRFKEYSRINFGYDLFLLRQGDSEFKVQDQKMRLTVATFDATLDKRRALWIPDNEQGEGTYYSYVSFCQ